MTRATCNLAISLDGFVAGPDQDRENPMGIDGLRLHQWHFRAGEPGYEAEVGPVEELLKPRSAYVMGRNMFGPIRGEWDPEWRGWWGEEPPYHAPVFVLTHYPRDPLEMDGGTTFHFVTDGFESAFEQAQRAAGGGEIAIAGGASTVRQAFAAGAIAEITLHVVPVLLVRGERLFDGVADPGLEPVAVIASPHATHVRYKIG